MATESLLTPSLEVIHSNSERQIFGNTDDDGIDVDEPVMEMPQQLSQMSIAVAEKEKLAEQNKILSLEIETYRQEVNKLKTENHDLAEELLSRNSALQYDEQAIKALKGKEQELFELHQRCETLELDAVEHKKQIQEWAQKYNEIQGKNEQYVVIIDKLQKEDQMLKDKVQREELQLKDLTDKYNALDEEYVAQETFAVQTVGMAERLRKDLSLLEKTHDTALETINSTEPCASLLPFGDAQKTLPMRPMTLRFEDSMVNSGPNTLREDAMQYYDGGTERSVYPEDDVMSHMKEELQMNFDNQLAEEKGKIIEKHKEEIAGFKEQIAEYKKELLSKENIVRALQTKQTDGGYIRRTNHQQNPNNQQDMASCKVLGYTMW